MDLPSAAVGRGHPVPGWAALREEEDRGRWGAERKTDSVTDPHPWLLQMGGEGNFYFLITLRPLPP